VLVKMHASGICFTDIHQRSDICPDHSPESSATSRWGRSWPWLLTSPRERSAIGWVPLGFNPRAGGANGACAAAKCSAESEGYWG
jgi:hypothetical protein